MQSQPTFTRFRKVRRLNSLGVICVGLFAALVFAGCGSVSGEYDAQIDSPEGAPVRAETALTVPPVRADTSQIALQPAPGEIPPQSVVVGPGRGAVIGTVRGPEGAIPGATVVVERYVGENSAQILLTTGADGTYRVDGALGGLYKVTAFRSPDLFSQEPAEGFGQAGTELVLDVNVVPINGVRIASAIAPNPPVLNQKFNIALRIGTLDVNPDGGGSNFYLAGSQVSVKSNEGVEVDGQSSAIADINGTVVFTLTCKAAGANSIEVTVSAATAGRSSTAQNVTFPACGDLSTTTTAPGA